MAVAIASLCIHASDWICIQPDQTSFFSNLYGCTPGVSKNVIICLKPNRHVGLKIGGRGLSSNAVPSYLPKPGGGGGENGVPPCPLGSDGPELQMCVVPL